MIVKATISFGGVINMQKDEVRDIRDKGVLDDLLSAGYVVSAEKKKKEKKTGKK